ncbi:hypothetical protein BGW80DRAFT_1459979 [Lactifluus volemus]|nr:hypothetical protein BGW80DRAFT_1459979 [Lactifluus volemus]
MTTPHKRYTPSTFEANIRSRSDVLPPTTEAAVRAETAARVEVRAGCHADDCHSEAVNKGGLHLNYLELWKETRMIKPGAVNSQADVVRSTLKDTIDSITMLDRIDGGFSLFLHAPGFLPPNQEKENTLIDGYLPPREVMNHGANLQAPLERILHTFLQDIAQPHWSHSQHYREVSKLPAEATEVQQGHRYSNGASFFATQPGSSHFLFQDNSANSPFNPDDSFASLDREMDWPAIVIALNNLENDRNRESGMSS